MTKKLFLLFVLLGISFETYSVEELYIKNCAFCHDTEVSQFPLLYGQTKSYLKKTMRHFKNGKRESRVMQGFAESLSSTDMRALSKYINSGDECDVAVKIETLGGSVEAGYAKSESCQSCHGAQGEGGSGPRLAGQKTYYLASTITAYRDFKRTTNESMSYMVEHLSDQDVKDVSAYYNSLRDCD